MKKWEKKFSGICVFALAAVLTVSGFTEVRAVEPQPVESTVAPKKVSMKNNRVTVVTDEEYENLKRGTSSSPGLMIADVDDRTTLDELERKSYSFDMKSWTEAES